jgi:hypothetical protein
MGTPGRCETGRPRTDQFFVAAVYVPGGKANAARGR